MYDVNNYLLRTYDHTSVLLCNIAIDQCYVRETEPTENSEQINVN